MNYFLLRAGVPRATGDICEAPGGTWANGTERSSGRRRSQGIPIRFNSIQFTASCYNSKIQNVSLHYCTVFWNMQTWHIPVPVSGPLLFCFLLNMYCTLNCAYPYAINNNAYSGKPGKWADRVTYSYVRRSWTILLEANATGDILLVPQHSCGVTCEHWPLSVQFWAHHSLLDQRICCVLAISSAFVSGAVCRSLVLSSPLLSSRWLACTPPIIFISYCSDLFCSHSPNCIIAFYAATYTYTTVLFNDNDKCNSPFAHGINLCAVCSSLLSI